MTTKLTLDKAGRVVIPKERRKELRLAPGDTPQLDTVGEQITLRPFRAEAPIRREDGVCVFSSGKNTDVSVRELIKEGREERHRSLLGRNR